MSQIDEPIAVTPAPTVGQMPVGIAGMLEMTKTLGIGGVLLAVLMYYMERDQIEQGRRFDGIEHRLESVQSDVSSLQGDVREMRVRQQFVEARSAP